MMKHDEMYVCTSLCEAAASCKADRRPDPLRRVSLSREISAHCILHSVVTGVVRHIKTEQSSLDVRHISTSRQAVDGHRLLGFHDTMGACTTRKQLTPGSQPQQAKYHH